MNVVWINYLESPTFPSQSVSKFKRTGAESLQRRFRQMNALLAGQRNELVNVIINESLKLKSELALNALPSDGWDVQQKAPSH